MPTKKFKSFNETFPHCAFALAIALIYPNQHNFHKRAIVFLIVVAINSLILYWFFIYLFKCLIELDMYNLSRNITIAILAALFFFKSFYVNWKAKTFAELLNKITIDLLKGNYLDEDYQSIYEHYIKLGKLGQTCWIFIPILLSSQFPIYAGVCTIYESIISDVGRRHMIHEIQLKHLEDRQYDTPYYELMFAYNLVQCIVLSPNFAGFDGSFCIATTHLRLKLKLVSHKIRRAFIESKNRDELEARVKEGIRDHQEALKFYKDLQDVYGGWLLAVFLMTSILISLNLYLNHLSHRIDPKYTIFAISGVVHMFTPCHFASNLLKSGEELSWDIYSAEWETWADTRVNSLLVFIISKSHQQLLLTGEGLVYFNMQLFISVMQTSYSFYTLISS
ncbi:unnamed protein product [Leptidea sinapis]|uniref:Odorant receptor n=1 Tax=Leptidea sinapis TaxID=189913 RepID=A0A5E4QMT3_9NEOP|nr:unnamed protein product [Leptidea sinapis]